MAKKDTTGGGGGGGSEGVVFFGYNFSRLSFLNTSHIIRIQTKVVLTRKLTPLCPEFFGSANSIELKSIFDPGKSLLRTRSTLSAHGFCGRQSWSY